MGMNTVGELRECADTRFRAGEFLKALHAYCALVRLQPEDLDARLRTADSLLALGEVQLAARVYAALARHAANAGYPLRALVAVKVLEALEPQLGQLLGAIASLYCAESSRLGRSTRLAFGDSERPMPAEVDLSMAPEQAQLVPVAAQLAESVEAIAAYPENLPPVPLFSSLPQEAFASLLQTLKLVRRHKGDHVISEGASERTFYVLARGSVRVVRGVETEQEVELAVLHDGSVFGEMALLSDQPRTASVVALDDCDLLEFDRDSLRAAATELGTIASALESFKKERLLQNLFATSPLFQPLDRKQRLDLARRFTAHRVAAGAPVIREGEPGRGVFVVLEGAVDVSKRDGDEKVLLATLGVGEVFGEISLLHDEPTTATVTAGVESQVLFLERALFRKLIDAVDELRDYFENLGDERLMDTRITMTSIPAPASSVLV